MGGPWVVGVPSDETELALVLALLWVGAAMVLGWLSPARTESSLGTPALAQVQSRTCRRFSARVRPGAVYSLYLHLCIE